jgi:aminoglycoside phosphotransferase (APT) family kinase protein
LECGLLPEIGLGLNHMVRIIEFVDNVRWVARLRMPQLRQNGEGAEKAEGVMDSEYRTMCIVEKESKIPVPHVHMFDADPNSHVGAQFMLMDCLQGNAGIDLSLNIPPERKLDVYTRMAEIQVCNYTINRPLF